MPFDFRQIGPVEFGVCTETEQGESFRLVPIDAGVQAALREMLLATLAELKKPGTVLSDFSPAEKYGSTERLRVPLDSEWVEKYQTVFAANNLVTDTHGLDTPESLISYFAVFRDQKNRKAMAFRRAAQFKGVVKKHLITFIDDTLQIVPDRLFKLDTDFDFVIVDNEILIWRPSGFIFTADMDRHIAMSAATNVATISQAVTCVDFSGIGDYVAEHKLAMRLVAALKIRADLSQISLKRLRASCKQNDIPVTVRDNKLSPTAGYEMDFLLLLDRRLYTLTLIDQHPETYQAAARSLTDRKSAVADPE